MSSFMRTMTDLHRYLGFDGKESRPRGKLITGICNLAFALLAVTALSASAAEVKYQLAPNFLGTPPGKEQIGNGHGEIAVDSAGLIYVSVIEKGAGIQVYGKDGKFIKALALPESLHGFTIRKSAEGEFLYGAVLNEQRFIKAKLDGTVVMEIKSDAFPADKGKSKDKAGKSVNAVFGIDF